MEMPLTSPHHQPDNTQAPGCRYSELWERENESAQAMLDDSWQANEIADELEDYERTSYGLPPAPDTLPPKAEYIVARAVRSVAMAAAERMVGDKLHCIILPSMRRGESLVPLNASNRQGEVWQTPGSGCDFVPGTACNAFASSVYEWSIAALELVQDEAARDPKHPYNPLFDVIDMSHKRCVTAHLAYSGEPLPAEDTADYLKSPRVESTSATLGSLLCSGLSADLYTGRNSVHDLAAYAAGRLPLLVEAATASKYTFPKIIPIDIGHVFQNHELSGKQAAVLADYATRFSPDGWTHASLTNGPWPKPRCMGVRPLRPASSAGHDYAEELFGITERRYEVTLPRHENNKYDQITSYIGFLGLNVAENSIYAQWSAIRPLAVS